jgi:hypothetical protein
MHGKVRGAASYHAVSLVVLFLVAAVLTACANRSEWQDLPISDAGFSVLMRGQPYYARQQQDTPAGKMTAHSYSSERPDSYFAVGYTDYPLALVVGSPPDGLFTSVRDTWIRRIDGKLVATDNSLKLAGKYPGVEFAGEGTSKGAPAFVQGRLYLVDQRLYQVVAMGRKNEVPQADVNRFLNSFRLIPQADVGSVRVGPGAK